MPGELADIKELPAARNRAKPWQEKMMSDFEPGSVAEGLRMNEFAGLPNQTKKKLVRLMARIAEQSYRRGFQHGTLGRHCIDPAEFRFDLSLDRSPFTDVVSGGYTSVERLYMECGVLRDLGF